MSDVDSMHQELLKQISDDYQKTEGFPTYDILRALAFGLLKIQEYAEEVDRKQDVDNLTGTDLERFISQRKGVSRKKATYATAVLTVKTGSGTITKGDLFSTSGGVRFAADSTVEVAEGDSFNVTAIAPGANGNVAGNTITEMPVTIAGISAVYNAEGSKDGYDAEDDDSLRERYYTALREPATSGNVYHYRQWALEVSGVGGSQVFPLWNGDNTVQVVIIDSDGLVPSADLVKEVQTYIDPDSSGKGTGQAPIGAYCTVTAATALSIAVSATLTIRANTTLEVVKGLVESGLKAYLKSVAFKSKTISVGKIGDIILNTDGVEDYDALTINGATTKITVPDKYVGVLGEVTLSEE